MKKFYILLFLLPITGAFAQVEGSWSLAQEAYSMAVGPTLGDYGWWHCDATCVVDRACFYDDEFVFNGNGTFMNVQGSESWVESWQDGADEGCRAPVAPHDGSNPATWTYDSGAGSLTVSGLGAYIGLPKVHNAGELTDPADAVAAITYPVVFNATNDTMTIDINYVGGYWHFVLAKNTPTNVQETAEDIFTIFPNPANSEIQINSKQFMERLTIRDITGKIVFSNVVNSFNEIMDLSNLPMGVYLLEMQSGNQRSTQKLILN